MSETNGQTREVPLAIALSVATGIALTESFDEIHELIEWMAGEPIWTHQLPRVGRECEAWLRRCDSRIDQLDVSCLNSAMWRVWLAEVEAEWGPMLTVYRLPPEEHRRVDPIAEATELFGQPPIVLRAEPLP